MKADWRFFLSLVEEGNRKQSGCLVGSGANIKTARKTQGGPSLYHTNRVAVMFHLAYNTTHYLIINKQKCNKNESPMH